MEKLHKEPGDYTKDSSSFTLELQKFHESRGSPFRHAPRINGRQVDLFALYNSVTAIGGWQKVNDLLKWDYILDKLNFPKACANASLALRQVYVRYLSLFEKVHFLGEDADEEADPGTESRSGRKSTGAALVQVPMSYNRAQHDIPESQRLVLGLAPCAGPSPEYNKLCMSLLSGLPNEEALTLNVCTLLSNEGRHSLKLDRMPRLVDLLLSQAGLFPADDPTLRPMLLESWQGVEGRRMERFWEDNLDAETIALYNIGRGSKDEEDELFNLNYEVGTRSIEGQRVLRIALIFHNLSFEERNAVILAKNRTFIRFVMLSALSRWSTLRQVALDTIGNLAAKLVLYPALDEDEDEASSGHHCYEDLAGERQRWSCSLLRLTREGIQSQDRYLVVRCLDILARLCRQERNAEPLLAALDTPLCRRVFELLTVHDLMLLIYALEALYMLSELGRDACERMLLVHRSMGILVSLLTLDPLVYGPLAQKGMKLIETIDPLLPPPQVPAAANNPAATPTSLPMSAPLTPSMVSTGGSTVGMNAPGTTTGVTGTTGPGPGVGPPAVGTSVTAATGLATTAAPQSDPMDTEAFAGTWVRAMYEPAPPGCMVARNDIYAEYVTFCSKAGRKSVISAAVFSNCVKAVYTQTGLRRVDGANGVVSFHHDGLRKRLNPLPVPIQVTSCLSISTQAAATTLRTPLASGGTASSHSPILKAQLSAPLRALTPPGNQVSPPPSPATTAPPVAGTPPAPPPPGGAPPGGSSNLIKSLLANKVSRNLQRHQQMQQQQQQSTVVTSADAEATPVTAGTPVLANSAAPTRTPEPVRREVNPASAVSSHQPQHHHHQPAVTAQSFSFVSTTSSVASTVTAGTLTAQTTQQTTTCLTSALQAKLQQQPQVLAHNSVQPQTQVQSLGTALHLRVQPHVQVQVPNSSVQTQQVQVAGTPAVQAQFQQQVQVHATPVVQTQVQQHQVQVQVPTQICQTPLHTQVQTAAGPVLIQSTQPATVVQGQPAQVVVSMAPTSQVPASISVPSVSVQTSMPVQTPLQVTFSTPVSTPLLASAIASAQSSVQSSVSAVGLTQTLPTSLATNVTSNLASGQTVVMAPNLASNLGGGSAVVVGSALPSNPVMAQGTSLAASLASGGGLPPGATIVMVPNSATGITTGMLVVRPQGKMPAGAVNAALLARSQAVANAINAGARGPLIVSTRPNGFQRDIVMEVSMPPEYKQELPPSTQQQVSATAADHPVHNHVGENGATANSTPATTTTAHKCIAILPSTTTTSGMAAETKPVESVVYKSSPLLNGLLDKGKVPLAMDSATMQNGSAEDEMAQHADGSTPMAISEDVNVAVTNGTGTLAKTMTSSDLSPIQDIVGSMESASKVISRSGVDVAASPALKRTAEPDGGGGCAKRLRLEDSSESTFQAGDATERQGSPPASIAPASLQQQSVVVMARTEGGGAQHVVVQQSVIQQNVTQHSTTQQQGGSVVQLGCTHQALVQPKTQPQTLLAPSATPQVLRVVTTSAAAVPQPNLVKLLSTMDSSKTVVTTVAAVSAASTTSATATVAAGTTTPVSTQPAEVKPVATASKTVVVDGEKKAPVATSSAAAHHHHHHHHHHKAAKLVYHCEWKGCDRTFSTPSAVFYHACKVHIPEADNDVQCQWDSCDDMKRRRLSLFTHLQDRHCNEQVLQIQAVRRQQISQFGKASLPPPAQPPPHPGYAPDAALLAIRRHALAYYNHRDASDEKESALAKSIRLTSALIIRNLATYSSRARRYLRRYEQQLSTVAMSPLESSRTIAQCLLEMSRVPTPD
ncbi:AT-rich interactive domain-containing protein 2 isoform X3 [Rhipicephalus sanguineus]|uniref:AT-rich interactive domain-containing protein 2 isoform X3 n=1 Tax=Rhipicephalus sanguineus TaxID=34632 RepID=UPI0020C4C5B0|nr:AT-rich interactive domain-containing protein 2 isoform X3 [Rhipicephalus sanguineus]